jgi:hypothetical protein
LELLESKVNCINSVSVEGLSFNYIIITFCSYGILVVTVIAGLAGGEFSGATFYNLIYAINGVLTSITLIWQARRYNVST